MVGVFFFTFIIFEEGSLMGGGGFSALHLQYHDEVPLSKAPIPNCSLGAAA